MYLVLQRGETTSEANDLSNGLHAATTSRHADPSMTTTECAEIQNEPASEHTVELQFTEDDGSYTRRLEKLAEYEKSNGPSFPKNIMGLLEPLLPVYNRLKEERGQILAHFKITEEDFVAVLGRQYLWRPDILFALKGTKRFGTNFYKVVSAVEQEESKRRGVKHNHPPAGTDIIIEDIWRVLYHNDDDIDCQQLREELKLDSLLPPIIDPFEELFDDVSIEIILEKYLCGYSFGKQLNNGAMDRHRLSFRGDLNVAVTEAGDVRKRKSTSISPNQPKPDTFGTRPRKRVKALASPTPAKATAGESTTSAPTQSNIAPLTEKSTKPSTITKVSRVKKPSSFKSGHRTATNVSKSKLSGIRSEVTTPEINDKDIFDGPNDDTSAIHRLASEILDTPEGDYSDGNAEASHSPPRKIVKLSIGAAAANWPATATCRRSEGTTAEPLEMSPVTHAGASGVSPQHPTFVGNRSSPDEIHQPPDETPHPPQRECQSMEKDNRFIQNAQNLVDLLNKPLEETDRTSVGAQISPGERFQPSDRVLQQAEELQQMINTTRTYSEGAASQDTAGLIEEQQLNCLPDASDTADGQRVEYEPHGIFHFLGLVDKMLDSDMEPTEMSVGVYDVTSFELVANDGMLADPFHTIVPIAFKGELSTVWIQQGSNTSIVFKAEKSNLKVDEQYRVELEKVLKTMKKHTKLSEDFKIDLLEERTVTIENYGTICLTPFLAALKAVMGSIDKRRTQFYDFHVVHEVITAIDVGKVSDSGYSPSLDDMFNVDQYLYTIQHANFDIIKLLKRSKSRIISLDSELNDLSSSLENCRAQLAITKANFPRALYEENIASLTTRLRKQQAALEQRREWERRLRIGLRTLAFHYHNLKRSSDLVDQPVDRESLIQITVIKHEKEGINEIRKVAGDLGAQLRNLLDTLREKEKIVSTAIEKLDKYRRFSIDYHKRINDHLLAHLDTLD